MKRVLIAVIATMTALTSASAQSVEARRTIYALITAGDEYCPDMSARFGITGITGDYDPSDEAEFPKYKAAMQNWHKKFRAAGRAKACDQLMDEFGPGTEMHLFDWD